MPFFPNIAEEIFLKIDETIIIILTKNLLETTLKILYINLVRVMQKEVGNISEENTQDKYIYTHTIIYIHMGIKTLKTSHCPHKTYNCA